MGYRIAICDDEQLDIKYIKELLHIWQEETNISLQIETFTSAENFLFHYAEDKLYDIILLDIELGGMDGVTMAKKIRKENKTVQIIFISGYSDYIAEGYEVEALHYLLKPVNKEKLFSVLQRAQEKIKQNDRNLHLEIHGEMVRIPLYEIRYVDVNLNYVTIYANKEYTLKRTLRDIEKDLDSRFVRVGRSIIINITFVQKVTKISVYLFDGTILPLPRKAYETINRAIIAYE
ncbi:MAG: LytTR family DNA-binding domain-containing protein [Clostridium sp.]